MKYAYMIMEIHNLLEKYYPPDIVEIYEKALNNLVIQDKLSITLEGVECSYTLSHKLPKMYNALIDSDFDKNYFLKNNFRSFIDCFIWANSVEGREYWGNLDKRFSVEYTKLWDTGKAKIILEQVQGLRGYAFYEF